MGASRWLTLSKYRRSIDCYEALREAGCRIVASDCPPATEDEGQESGASFQTIKQHEFDAKPIDALSFEAGKPVALVFDGERRGISRQFVERADDAFYLPRAVHAVVQHLGGVRDGALRRDRLGRLR